MWRKRELPTLSIAAPPVRALDFPCGFARSRTTHLAAGHIAPGRRQPPNASPVHNRAVQNLRNPIAAKELRARPGVAAVAQHIVQVLLRPLVLIGIAVVAKRDARAGTADQAFDMSGSNRKNSAERAPCIVILPGAQQCVAKLGLQVQIVAAVQQALAEKSLHISVSSLPRQITPRRTAISDRRRTESVVALSA